MLDTIDDHRVNGRQLSNDDNVIMTMSGGKRYSETTNGSHNMKIKQITSNHQQLSKDDNVIVTMSGGKHYNETTNGSYHRIIKQMTSKINSKYLQEPISLVLGYLKAFTKQGY